VIRSSTAITVKPSSVTVTLLEAAWRKSVSRQRREGADTTGETSARLELLSMSSSKQIEPRRSMSAYVSAAVVIAVVIALPLVAHLVDGSADEFSRNQFQVLPAIGWFWCALLLAVVVTRRAQIAFAVEEGAGFAVAYDVLPLLLLSAWLVGIVAALSGHWLLVVMAAGLCGYHCVLVIPRFIASRRPRWTRHAPRWRLAVANVFVDNETPELAARQMIDAAADVLVLVESTAKFLRVFDGCGGDEAYPQRVFDPDDDSDYAIAIVTNRELGSRSEFRRLGPLRLAIAEIQVGGIDVLVVALNPMAAVDPGGHVTWKEQIEVLKEFVPTLDGPVIIAGDLNTTRYRPEFEELLALGYDDAIDSLGKGLNPSFKLASGGLLGAIGPVARLDHALVNQDLHALSIKNLESCGSDHLPFIIELAVRSSTTLAGPPTEK
jgi:endonuclease/exonuclease/phosphatase (EEP) superfamily protein YafD